MLKSVFILTHNSTREIHSSTIYNRISIGSVMEFLPAEFDKRQLVMRKNTIVISFRCPEFPAPTSIAQTSQIDFWLDSDHECSLDMLLIVYAFPKKSFNPFCPLRRYIIVWKWFHHQQKQFSIDGMKKKHIELQGGVFSWCNGYSDGLRNRCNRVRTSVALLRSLLGKYPGERYEPPYLPQLWVT